MDEVKTNSQSQSPKADHKPFQVVYDTGNRVERIEYDTEEEAKLFALDILQDWIYEEQRDWIIGSAGEPYPTDQQIESWNRMIAGGCRVYVVVWNDEKNDYEELENAWVPSQEEEYEADWLCWEDLKKKHDWERWYSEYDVNKDCVNEF